MVVLYVTLALIVGWLFLAFLNATIIGLYDRFSDSECEEGAFNFFVAMGPIGTIIITIAILVYGVRALYTKTFTTSPFLVVYEKVRYYK